MKIFQQIHYVKNVKNGGYVIIKRYTDNLGRVVKYKYIDETPLPKDSPYLEGLRMFAGYTQ